MGWDHIISAIVALIGGIPIGAWLLRLYQQRHDYQRTDRKDAIDYLSGIIDRLDKELGILRQEQSRAIAGERLCREELAGMRSDGRWMYTQLAALHAAAKKAGVVSDDLPSMPERFLETKSTAGELDFAERQSAHSEGLLHREAAEVRWKKPPSDPGPKRTTTQPNK